MLASVYSAAIMDAMTERLRVGNFTPMTCEEILDKFDFVPDTEVGVSRSWYGYCQLKNGLTEYPTVEYVVGMAQYLTSRIAELDISSRPARILEVAAGRGLFSALISKVLQQGDVPHTITAVDDGSWPMLRPPRPEVEILDFRQALGIYKPDIVMGAWLPEYSNAGPQNWSHHFRQNEQTKEYLLIGPPNKHASREDWGRTIDPVHGLEVETPVPFYAQEGFYRVDLSHLQPVQFCADSVIHNLHPSLTVSFRRS